jgi:hypothetical protein
VTTTGSRPAPTPRCAHTPPLRNRSRDWERRAHRAARLPGAMMTLTSWAGWPDSLRTICPRKLSTKPWRLDDADRVELRPLSGGRASADLRARRRPQLRARRPADTGRLLHLERMLAAAIRRGTQVGLCGSCVDARAIREEQLIEGTHRSNLPACPERNLRRMTGALSSASSQDLPAESRRRKLSLVRDPLLDGLQHDSKREGTWKTRSA